jgi:hypothetical protein
MEYNSFVEISYLFYAYIFGKIKRGQANFSSYKQHYDSNDNPYPYYPAPFLTGFA